MKTEELTAILDSHAAWLRGEGGKRANLYGANLYGANLSGANLRGAYLSHASVAWSGHGTCGRQLLCVVIDGVPMYFCGCFRGTADELNAYIDADVTQPERVTQSRRKALWIVSDLISEVSVCD